jgi:hypothetical protein
MGLVISPVAEAVIAAADPGRRGSAAALVIALRLVGMTVGVAALTLYGVPRQDALRRAGVADPLAASDPARFLLDVATQVIGETFLLGAVALVIALAAGWCLDHERREVGRKTRMRYRAGSEHE